MNRKALAQRIDHTILSADATPEQIDRLIDEAREHGFAAVCVNPVYVRKVKSALEGTHVKTAAVVGFPLGANTPALKAVEAAAVANDGAEEIDFVAHLPTLIAGDVKGATLEFNQIVKAAKAANPHVEVKVILETAALMAGVATDEGERRVKAGCEAAREAGCDFVKTSTGFHKAGGASLHAVGLLKQHAAPLKVKAAGGIRTRTDALAMLEAGADRLGCSASVTILSES